MDSNPLVLLEVDSDIVKPISYWKLYHYSTRLERILVGLSLTLAVISGALLPLLTLIFGDLLNTFSVWQFQQSNPGLPAVITASGFEAAVADKAVYFVYLAIANFFSTYIFMAIAVYTSLAASHRIRSSYLNAVLRQDMGYFDTVGAGEVATRITSDTLLIQDAIGEKLPLAAASISTFLAGITIALIKSWKLTLVLLCVIPFIGVTTGIINVIGGKFQIRIQSLYGESGNIAEESIAAARTVTAFNAQEKIARRFNKSLAGARKEGIRKYTVTGIGLGLFSFFLYCSYSLCFWYGSKLLATGEISVGIVINVFFAVLIGAFALGQLAPDLQAFAFGIGAGAKIFHTIERVPIIDPYATTGVILDKKTFKGRITLEKVVFAYPSRKDVQILKGLSLEVEPGQTVALVGESGSSKSTIVQLLERFYDPDQGRICIDGIPLVDINVQSLRRFIGLVSQEPTLFEGSIYENVSQGLVGSDGEHVSDVEKRALVKEACVQANADEFIMKLTEGYDTQVGERGLLMSGGQKQRIAIARAIIKDPRILLLDEATSALDTTSEKVVQQALDKVSKSRTTIAIAHRLSTIKKADQIVVMVRGEIVEKGKHEELVLNEGLYSRLVIAQEITQKEGAVSPTSAGEVESVKVTLERKKTKVISVPLKSELKSSLLSIVLTVAKLNRPELKYTIVGLLASMGAGIAYPFFSISFGAIINVFSEQGPSLESDSNYWAVIFLVIAILSFIFSTLQNAMFGYASELLTERLRKLGFQAILRQDIGFFDDESTGSLTSNLSSDAQNVQGVSGLSLGNMLQIATNLVGNVIVAFIFGPKLAAVAFCALPLLVFTGMVRLKVLTYFAEKSAEDYKRSAQVACESVAAIKTVQSLTREKSVYEVYQKMLEKPLNQGLKSAFTNTILYAISQSANFLVNGLVFWYGGRLIAREGYNIQQFFTVFVAIVFGSQGAGRIFAYAPDVI